MPTPKQLPSGSWTVYLRAEGQSVTEPTRELCLARCRAVRAGFVEARKAASGMTLGAAYDAYMEARQGVISPSTYSGYLKLKRSTFQPLMQQDVQRITAEQVQREISQMALEGRAGSTSPTRSACSVRPARLCAGGQARRAAPAAEKGRAAKN
ncbi:MAG: hypothetical protein ACLSHJ_06950 [Oscillospiraceae bacterium]